LTLQTELFKKLRLKEKSIWVSGAWRKCASVKAVINPANGQSIGIAGLAELDGLETAIATSKQAFSSWRSCSSYQRADVLRTIESKLLLEIDALAKLLSMEQGKPIAQAKAEVEYAASFFRWYSEEARRLQHRVTAHPESSRQFLIESQAAGVAALITPWNFPLAQAAKKIAAALAAGCSAIWKPSELTPFIALALGPLFKDCGLPDDVVQICPAIGRVAGEVFGNSEAIAVISVTGSTQTGQKVLQSAARYLPKVSLELGGNAPFIVLPEVDMDLAIEDLARLKLLCSGQVCVSANRVFVQRKQKETFLKKLVSRFSQARLGPGHEAGVEAGPLIHQQACEKVSNLIHTAETKGAKKIYENSSYTNYVDSKQGSFFPLTIIDQVDDAMEIACDEVFGPVAAILTYESIAEVIQRANATRFGLAAYVYGANKEQTLKLAQALEVGIVGINEWRPLRAEIPFGGVKMSGLGSEGGLEGIREFLDTKVISMPKW